MIFNFSIDRCDSKFFSHHQLQQKKPPTGQSLGKSSGQFFLLFLGKGRIKHADPLPTLEPVFEAGCGRTDEFFLFGLTEKKFFLSRAGEENRLLGSDLSSVIRKVSARKDKLPEISESVF